MVRCAGSIRSTQAQRLISIPKATVDRPETMVPTDYYTEAAAAWKKPSTLSAAMANDATTGATNAPAPINRFRVARLLSSTPSRAALRFEIVLVHSVLPHFTVASFYCHRLQAPSSASVLTSAAVPAAL